MAAISTPKATPFKNLDSCSAMSELKQHHAQIIKLGLSSDNDAVGRVVKFCALSESGDLGYALNVFDLLPHPDAFVYNTMFRGYLQARLHRNCISLYSHMLRQNISPNKFSFPPLIRACSFDRLVEEGNQIHVHVIKNGLSQDSYCQNNLIRMFADFNSMDDAKRVFDNLNNKDDVSWTTLISGYSHLGLVDEAYNVFKSMPVRNPSSWNAVIAGHVQNNRFRDAFKLFDEMRRENVGLDNFVAASMLAACIGLGSLDQGEWIYEYIKNRGILIDQKLGNTVIDMYCKCGNLDKAQQVFRELKDRTVSSWNCLIGGFAVHGKGKDAIELFGKMEKTMTPDYVTFVNLLGACAHSGLVEEGKYYFSYMTRVYGIVPGMEHYGCLVDLLGRAGMIKEAEKVIESMPMKADVGVLGALLGACKIHGNIEIGEKIGKEVIELDPENSGRYVLLANLYAKAGRYEDVARIRKLMNDRGVKKVAGFSMIELEGSVHEFIAGGRAHSEAEEIYAKVEQMLVRIKERGYVLDSDSVLKDVCEEENENPNPLSYHSEKLAIAFGLLKTSGGVTIRITKNLRVCRDCHQASKLISEVYNREIIVRDRNRFHHFKGGVCSCNDYW